MILLVCGSIYLITESLIINYPIIMGVAITSLGIILLLTITGIFLEKIESKIEISKNLMEIILAIFFLSIIVLVIRIVIEMIIEWLSKL